MCGQNQGEICQGNCKNPFPVTLKYCLSITWSTYKYIHASHASSGISKKKLRTLSIIIAFIYVAIQLRSLFHFTLPWSEWSLLWRTTRQVSEPRITTGATVLHHHITDSIQYAAGRRRFVLLLLHNTFIYIFLPSWVEIVFGENGQRNLTTTSKQWRRNFIY